ncbi:MAG: phosphoadenylyl-sulfate reductase [Akkermansiaceae bacterium]
MCVLSSNNILNELESHSAEQRISMLGAHFAHQNRRMMLSTSFGLQAAVMLHLVSKHAPETPIVWVDTGYLFPETYRYAEDLIGLLDLDVRVYQPALSAARQEALHGKLWQQGEEGYKAYGLLNKVEPMNRALRELGADVWLSGLRKSQSGSRSNRKFAEQQKSTLKVYPILDWSDQQVEDYYREHQLPKHPLAAKGYRTMGDWHSTEPAPEGEDAEQSRFGGKHYECGLHLDSGANDFQI